MQIVEQDEEGVVEDFTCDFRGIHGIWQILFVSENQENGISKFVFVQHPVQLLPSFSDSLPIVAVDHEDQSLSENNFTNVTTDRRTDRQNDLKESRVRD